MIDKVKTYKREVAIIILLWNFYLSVEYVEALKVMVIPSFAFVGLAFGLDWHGKVNKDKE